VFEQNTAIEKLALFFYFSFMDEAKALGATKHCLPSLRRRAENQKNQDWESILVEETFKTVRKRKEFGSLSRVGFVQGHVNFPTGSNWGPWFEYRKIADPEEFATLIWIKLLGLSIEAVAKGLNVTSGTVRYRLSNGLKALGAYVQPGEYA
jgi:hypothetical protein